MTWQKNSLIPILNVPHLSSQSAFDSSDSAMLHYLVHQLYFK